MKHTISVLVENKPGVLARVAGLFSRRGFNIHSLAVGETEVPKVSRMTIVVDLPEKPVEHVTKQLNKLIPIIKVVELESSASVERELMLVKVSASRDNRAPVIELAEVFRSKIVDVSADAITIEVTGAPEKIAAFTDLVRPYGIVELARTGRVALARGSRGIGQKRLRIAGGG